MIGVISTRKDQPLYPFGIKYLQTHEYENIELKCPNISNPT
jgi:hypothetical protein